MNANEETPKSNWNNGAQPGPLWLRAGLAGALWFMAISPLAQAGTGELDQTDPTPKRTGSTAELDRDIEHLRAGDSQAESAAIRLGTMGDKRAVEPLLAALTDENPLVRKLAARTLGILGDKRAFEPLVAALRDKDPTVGGAAANALAALGDKRAFEPLVAALRDKSPDVGGAAASALVDLDDKRAVEPLLAALTDETPSVRELAARTLGRLGEKRAVEPLIAALRDKDSAVGAAAATALGRLSDKRALDPLVAALRHEESTVRGAAADALAVLGDRRAGEPLFAALKDADPKVRTSALMALGILGDRRAIEPLVAMLQDEKEGGRAALLLACFGDTRALEPLLWQTENNCMAAMAVGGALTLIEPPPVEALITLLKQDNFNIRTMAASALSRVGDQRAVAPLIEVTEDERIPLWAVGPLAAALVELDDKRAVDSVAALLRRCNTPAREAQKKTAEDKGVIGAPDVEYLIRVLNRRELVGHEGAVEQASAAWVLGWLGDQRAVEPLAALLSLCDGCLRRDPDCDPRYVGYVRWIAALALGRLGDQRAIQPLVAELKLIAALDDGDAAVWRQAFGRVPRVSVSEECFTERASEQDAGWMEELAKDATLLFPSEAVDKRRASCAGALRRHVPKIVDALVTIGPPAVEPLKALLEDKDELVRRSASEALRKLGR